MSASLVESLAKMVAGADKAGLMRVRGESGGDGDKAAEAGGFELLWEPPDWFPRHFLDASQMFEQSAFLADFVDNMATAHWAGGEQTALKSGPWEESDDCFFEAEAWTMGGEAVLLLASVDEKVDRQREYSQRSHERSLNHRKLTKRIESNRAKMDELADDSQDSGAESE